MAVRAGEQIGECGNSGNSSEPHLHFQLQDHQRVAIAAGLPAWQVVQCEILTYAEDDRLAAEEAADEEE